MRRIWTTAAAVVALAGCAHAAPANHVREAETFVKAALGDDCDMDDRKDIPVNAKDQEGVSHFVYSLSWHNSWDSKGEAPQTAELYQMFCSMGAYNLQYAFLLRDSNSGTFRLLSFARPNSHYDYTDDSDTQLKSPPRITGYGTDTTLVNATFDAKTQTIRSHANWRGLGDAWDAGQWRFADGAFNLVRFEIDPTYDSDDKTKTPKSYVVFSVP